MNVISKIRYRMRIRIEFQKADEQTLKITKEELNRELQRRNKEKIK